MKNKILPVLFAFAVLLTANQASAYYSPSTGRWLSRDPSGELGFETLRASSAVPRVGQVANSASLPPSRLFVRDTIATKKEPNRYGFVHNDALDNSDLLGKDTNLPPGGDPFDPWPYAPPPYHNPHQPIDPPSLPPGYVGGEADFFFGGGFSRVVCCDENGTKRIFWYSKVCIGGAIGIGGGGGVISGMSGQKCRASNYAGWFYETGISRGIGGGGVDIGYQPFPGTENWPIPMPGGLSGVNEAGGGLGKAPIGVMFKSTWCYYMLISEKDIPCGCK
jgi:hypothetical protein